MPAGRADGRRVRPPHAGRGPGVAAWAEHHAGVTEVRDQPEILTLATAMDLINSEDEWNADGVDFMHKGEEPMVEPTDDSSALDKLTWMLLATRIAKRPWSLCHSPPQ